jgi:hypothetical protein
MIKTLSILFLASLLLIQAEYGSHQGNPASALNGTGSLSARRFFNDSSFWNLPLPENPVIDPKSDHFIALLKTEPTKNNFGINLTRYTVPVYETDSSTPGYFIKHVALTEKAKRRWTHPKDSYGHGKEFDAGAVPIPDGAMADSAGDHHLAVIDWHRMVAWDMWGARKLPDGSWQSNTGMKYPLDGPGVFDPFQFSIENGESIHFYGPGRAAGVPVIAGLIMFDEIIAGEIRHKLACATRFNAYQEFVFPATWTDGFTEGGIPEGAIIQLDPSLDLSKFDLLPGEIIVARALQRYGAVIVDAAGGNVIYGEGLYGKPGKSWNGILREWKGGVNSIPLSCYRVLKLINIVHKGDDHNYRRNPH